MTNVRPVRLGLSLFLVSQGVFFFMLLVAFVYFQRTGIVALSRGWNVEHAAIHTVFLFLSGLTMWKAVSASRRTSLTRMWPWLFGTLALGALFLVGQGSEYLALVRQGITIGQSPLHAAFFTLVGLHAIYALAGILLLAIIPKFALARHGGPSRENLVESAALYWYFVAALWLAIFCVSYLQVLR